MSARLAAALLMARRQATHATPAAALDVCGLMLLPASVDTDEHGRVCRTYVLLHESGESWPWAERWPDGPRAIADVLADVLDVPAPALPARATSSPAPAGYSSVFPEGRTEKCRPRPHYMRDVKPAADMGALAAEFDAALGDVASMPMDEVNAELGRLGINTAPAFEKVKRAIEVARSGRTHYAGDGCQPPHTDPEPTMPPTPAADVVPAIDGHPFSAPRDAVCVCAACSQLTPETSEPETPSPGAPGPALSLSAPLGAYPSGGLNDESAGPSNGATVAPSPASARAVAASPDPQDSAGPDTSSGPAPTDPCFECGFTPCACKALAGEDMDPATAAAAQAAVTTEMQTPTPRTYYVPPSIYKCRDCGESPCRCRGESQEPLAEPTPQAVAAVGQADERAGRNGPRHRWGGEMGTCKRCGRAKGTAAGVCAGVRS